MITRLLPLFEAVSAILELEKTELRRATTVSIESPLESETLPVTPVVESVILIVSDVASST